MEEKIQALVALLRSDDDDQVEETKSALIALAEQSGKRTVYNLLESLKRSEVLTVQWEIEEVMEILIPPKVAKVIEEPEGELTTPT